ncbi:CocE/NonD family hydrolase [Pseudoroseicyclus aestuarii]|uniref:Xaa-Pro dipeptidyl-peptidase C-terminal domain-containing protein n=1 Tax=Pseudoroseicyclus aestuarii TaxID=1795041 RepID=A0A318SUF7_9RHOB|nr:CocE/NonD family hydrolase [Pseudoroseicyclus aestuarii]PYE84009.1 hypothetical protein DFP88_103372 [Pseudoroseicyclus aestuarii]
MPDTDFTVIENHWIDLADGTRLAARIWMPKGAEADPVPAVLEFLPYRKRDQTAQRDESTYPTFAENGIAGVRVDIRGSGESSGIIDDEYSSLELANACEVIDWIAAQPWSNGNVGMMGISWGGFNALQVAALRPAPLKAVISIASTVDRYNDDIHYKNGCMLSANMGWAATMQAFQSRPPDPAIVGDDWRAMWLERLEKNPDWAEDWFRHQRRDDYWRHASICEGFDAVQIPALVIAGWADGYRNTPIKAIEGLGPQAKALIGPWVHKYPHFAWPKPRVDFLGEAVAWWNRWLKDEANGAEDWPQLRAFRSEANRPPSPRRDRDEGTWLAVDDWQRPALAPYHVDAAGALSTGEAADAAPRAHYLRSPLDTGIMAGEWFTSAPTADMSGDQRSDDGGSLCFQTPPQEAPLDLLGMPELRLRLSCEDDWANLCARLVDVHPDGTAYRIAYGVLNLAHRDGNADPAPMPRGEMVDVTLRLDACGYRLRPGHSLRLAISTAYWPVTLPAPTDPGVTIDLSSIRLGLPLQAGAQEITLPEPEDESPLPEHITHEEGHARHWIETDRSSMVTTLHLENDGGLVEHPETGMSSRVIQDEAWSITANDPNSATGRADWICEVSRPGWHVRTRTSMQLACTAEEWLLSGEVVGKEDGTEVYRRPWSHRIPRDFT